jgi:hypothetical protein
MSAISGLRGPLVLFLIFFLPRGIHAEVAATNPMASYGELERRVREALAEGRERTADAVERERVHTSWEVGKLIDEHILLHKERADYGEQVLDRLAGDIGISLTELRYMVQFARAYPIRPTSGELSWSHYRDLLAVNDDQKRDELARRADKENWTIKETRREIEKLKSSEATSVSEAPADEPLVPLKGSLDTYRVVLAHAGEWQGRPVIDLGFSNFYRPNGHFPFHEGDIIRVSKNGKPELAKDATEADLYTYRAYVLEITDGDTLWVLIDLGFGFSTKQQLRLRGLDAPEISSRDGQEAKRFVERELRSSPEIIIASTQSDKYDRYLADIFYQTKNGEQFLNGRLLQERLAERV